MSEVSEAAIVRIVIADYVANDAAGKLNLLGGNLAIIGVQGQTLGASEGNTAPFGVAVSIQVGPGLYNAEAAVELVLEDSTNNPVLVPTPDGKGRQAMRIAQNVAFEAPNFPPGVRIPRNTVPARSQWALMFPSGLPLPPGNQFHWRVKIDHESRDDWAEFFYVPAAPGPLVVG